MYTEDDFKASVGKYGPTRKLCYNTLWDQKMIWALLNAIPERRGGAGGKLTEPIYWKVISEELYQAILKFQKANLREGLQVDGHVDPHGKTLRLLLRLSKETPPADPGIVPLGPLFIPRDVGGRVFDPTDDPNLILAGDQFRIKALEAVSFGDGLGLTSISFAIWDIKNNRAAAYEYVNLIMTAGTPITLTDSEGDWSEPFTTSKFLQVDQFDGMAKHTGWGAGSLGEMKLTLLMGNPFCSPCTVIVPTGFSKGIGLDESPRPGSFKLVSGTVKVFKGP